MKRRSTAHSCMLPLPPPLLLQSYAFQWAWHPHEGCDVRRREWPEIGAVFQNKTLAFTGDSHVRFVHNWIAEHLGGEQLGAAAVAGARQLAVRPRVPAGLLWHRSLSRHLCQLQLFNCLMHAASRVGPLQGRY